LPEIVHSTNEKAVLREDNRTHYYLDCWNPTNDRVIEFYGDYWHANPNKYAAEDRVLNGETAASIWKRNRERLDYITSKGYNVLIITEEELRSNPVSTLIKALTFLSEGKISAESFVDSAD
jgi:very-short-patch-repair endonuclease